MEKVSGGCVAGWIAGILVVGAAAVLIAAYAVLIHVHIAVDEASLTRFDLMSSSSSSPSLAYNLWLTLTIRNPNWAITIKNKKNLEASYSFDGQVFDRVLVAEKGDKQGPRRTRVYHLAVASASPNGTAVPAFGSAGAEEFRRQNATGFFDVEVKVTGKFQYTGRYTKCELDATCPLKLQLAPPGTQAVVFEKVKCKLDKPKKYC
ncbi:hypothetical protein HU200_015680 [Digitaria exilis]|uniref:Late embryogenesis abundant protein LEA-2 subgroup domain-containing protein n=1 Tax=Digitaria exilis TaxID=1010633 RepID=A0A835F8N5_9POAL|nr:hypothetical protein HU200_015680 [Digitaria exilis]CAB3456214.1 unnamed protein product [Digitaria exilis]